MRSRFRNHPHQSREHQYPDQVRFDEGFQVPITQAEMHNQKGKKSPDKDPPQMLPYDVPPDVFLDVVVGSSGAGAANDNKHGQQSYSLKAPGAGAEKTQENQNQQRKD